MNLFLLAASQFGGIGQQNGGQQQQRQEDYEEQGGDEIGKEANGRTDSPGIIENGQEENQQLAATSKSQQLEQAAGVI
jgi:hypothetical protein